MLVGRHMGSMVMLQMRGKALSKYIDKALLAKAKRHLGSSSSLLESFDPW